MRRLQRGGKKFGPWRTAGGVRDALMVAFLAWRPIRLENLTAIELDRHFAKVENRFWCTFVPAETKEKRPLEFPMPEALTSWLDLYISVHRPLLLRGRKSPRLWISTRSTPMVDNSIYYRVKACTERLVGHPLNPHLFRDCAATTIAELAPEDIGIISRILGHSSLRSAELHYNQAGMLAAGSRYHRTLDEIRG
jgi:integrase/recombinase XerD